MEHTDGRGSGKRLKFGAKEGAILAVGSGPATVVFRAKRGFPQWGSEALGRTGGPTLQGETGLWGRYIPSTNSCRPGRDDRSGGCAWGSAATLYSGGGTAEPTHRRPGKGTGCRRGCRSGCAVDGCICPPSPRQSNEATWIGWPSRTPGVPVQAARLPQKNPNSPTRHLTLVGHNSDRPHS
jgi:hypothetical protein